MITTIQNCVLISVFIFHTHMHLFKKSFIIKLYTLFTLLVSISSKTVNYGEPLETDKLIKIINRNKASWKAGRNFHSSIKKHHVRSLMGLKIFSSHTCLPKKISLEKFGTPEVPIPDSFDARKKWPFCKSLQNLTDQGNCGSCWAVSSTSTFSDRMCIASKGKFNKILSAEELISCCTTCGEGCFGGYDDHAWKHLKIEGIVTGGDYGSNEGCQPYTMKPCEHTPEGPLPHCKDIGKMKTPQCQRQCINNLYKIPYDEDHHRAKEIYYLSDVEEIQRDIITYGPIQTGYTVYEDFLSYKNGVYHHVSGDKIGLHAVKVIGWGSENNVPYWLVQNSWNEYWGDKGYFKIIRGNNECGFESRMYAGYPLV